MALVSYHRNFIYLKTHRTASTSSESFLERDCLAPGEFDRALIEGPDYPAIPETRTSWGIVGARGPFARTRPRPKVRNHMNAAALKAQLDPDFWRGALKICNTRNPWDKTVSTFWGGLSEDDAAAMAARPFSDIRQAFQDWLADGGRMAQDRDKYMIDGTFCVDFVIRYEALSQGLKRVCEKVGTDFQPERLPQLGAHKRGPVPNSYPDYYTAALRDAVAEAYAPEIERFGYRFDEA